MEQNSTINSTIDNDLQKAIDDITNNTNIDPVFSDPVAAPSSVPEGDTGELGDPVGPFPAPTPPPVAEAFDFIDLPAPEAEPLGTDVANATPPEAKTPASAPPVSINIPEPVAPIISSESHFSESAHPSISVHQVKEAALRDLIPILDRIHITPSQKFKTYKDIFETLKDYTVVELAYRAATEIPDDTERAEALFYLIDAIDKM